MTEFKLTRFDYYIAIIGMANACALLSSDYVLYNLVLISVYVVSLKILSTFSSSFESSPICLFTMDTFNVKSDNSSE